MLTNFGKTWTTVDQTAANEGAAIRKFAVDFGGAMPDVVGRRTARCKMNMNKTFVMTESVLERCRIRYLGVA